MFGPQASPVAGRVRIRADRSPQDLADVRRSASAVLRPPSSVLRPQIRRSASASTMAATTVEFPSLTEIKRALPRHCFEASVPWSMYYLVRSLVLAAGLVFALASARPAAAAALVDASPAAAAAADAALCATYVFLQGVVFWGFFTVGHDCGHGAFSRFHALNFVAGTFIHSLILTPFETWKLSHRHHHKNTGNIDRDEIFYPQRRHEQHELARSLVRPRRPQ